MSHLGERASALIDGELGHAERERALAHLTFCADCRAELDAMRALKSRLRSLDPPAMPADLTMSLLRMSEPGGPLPPRVRPFPTTSYSLNGAPADNRPRRGSGFSGPGRSGGNRRAGYVAVGVASAAVALGTLFMVGGVDNRPPSPPVEMFANQHGATVPSGRLLPGREVVTPTQQP
ncbi:anti-sigma factor family protein [Sphaerisporangium perillae]|uniref:anti-sigma factor family protein n=1 Tax=Sphaerisporangium perillae TaxID=2935860 RepID=UPI0020105A59|nr:zf-HC2 domain-containing protein [Sphaerisporangium perillae]